MKSKKVETVTSDEENLRLQIFDGEIPLSEAGAELVRLLGNQLGYAHERAMRMIADAAVRDAQITDLSRSLRKATASTIADRGAAARATKPKHTTRGRGNWQR